MLDAPAVTAYDLLGTDVAVMGLPLGGWADAPRAVRAASRRYAPWLVAAARASGVRVVDYGDVAVDGADIGATFLRAHEHLADIVAAGSTPLVLGGDALVTVPVLQVLSGKLRGRLGVVAFSPHLDLELETAHVASGRWTQALELGVLEPRNFVVIGERGAPDESRARSVFDALEARRFTVADTGEAGMAAVAREALEAATSGTEAVYISVDLRVVEGVEDPVGIGASALSAALAVVAESRLAGADVCGVVPGGQTSGAASLAARAATDIVLAVARQRG